MKQHLRFFLFIGALLPAVAVRAENKPEGKPAAKPSYGEAKQVRFDDDRTVDKKLTLLMKKVNLTPEQNYRAKQALQDQSTKLDLLGKEYNEQKKKISDDTDGVFMGILNPSQQEAYQKIKPEIVGRSDTEARDPRDRYRPD